MNPEKKNELIHEKQENFRVEIRKNNLDTLLKLKR